ncbi:hypothetical protein Dsin_000135 [Dipteronia sinensis]|uniref:RNase H type-1 domain-containing protein n=1 Tax=Dipteronia sinensis TaxID=43782 RepID=A0AAE0DGV9_9ROSI|nr:hypothetical protein Dsin_000135 [Dipteronia sinensis]
MSVSFSEQVRTLWKAAIYAVIWGGVSEANRLEIGCMRNCMENLLIIHQFGLQDGDAMGSLLVGGCGGIFWNYIVFVKGFFAIPLGQVFEFEVEFLAALLAINFAWKYGWLRIWLESDSSYRFSFFLLSSEMVP